MSSCVPPDPVEADAVLPPSVLLMGPRASGKTSVGAELARQLSRCFVDLDELTFREFEAGSIREIWEQSGQAAWRRAEVRVLDRVLAADGRQVVALGGGTPMIDAAREMVALGRRRGRLVTAYLQCAVATLQTRLAATPSDRPSLTGRPIDEEIADVLAEREPTYLQLADVIQPADREAPTRIAADLIQRLVAVVRR